jgi:hypothetical protein
MCWQHKEAIRSWRACNSKESKLNIRSRCNQTDELKDGYNKVLKTYKTFLCVHSSLIGKFIMKGMPHSVQETAVGTGGTLISQIMKRYSVIDEQLLS